MIRVMSDGIPVRIPLSRLARGQKAMIECSALAGLPNDHRCLLEAMGMGESCQVRVCRPGSPCIVQIDQTRLGLSKSVADMIMVTPIKAD
ncbi:MAG: ferrous iron transport protein A [Phycisphaerales bacterium]|nr:ferrous iron transport protein A [Phycisphaerales bacterium]